MIGKVITAINMPDQYFFTPSETAVILQIDKDMVWEYIKKYKILFAVRLINQYRIPRVAVEHFIRKGMECVLEDAQRGITDEVNMREFFPNKSSFNKHELSRILHISERSLNHYISEGYLEENDKHRIDRINIIHFLETMK